MPVRWARSDAPERLSPGLRSALSNACTVSSVVDDLARPEIRTNSVWGAGPGGYLGAARQQHHYRSHVRRGFRVTRQSGPQEPSISASSHCGFVLRAKRREQQRDDARTDDVSCRHTQADARC